MTQDEDSVWDHRFAAAMDGATVLVGLTYNEPTGERYEQFAGTVMSATPDSVVLRLEGERAGDLFTLPPDLSAFHPASPGRYTLRGSGEVVDDPDYTKSWTVTPPRS